MSHPILDPTPAGSSAALGKFHLLAWRWHFYAGLYVVPFLTMLASLDW